MDTVCFSGGIGNQMFQYAFAETLRNRGRNTNINLGFYREHPELRPFVLDRAFRNVEIVEANNPLLKDIDAKWKGITRQIKKDRNRTRIGAQFLWIEDCDEEGVYVPQVYDTHDCIFVGYWQSYKYYKDMKNRLRRLFSFSDGEDNLMKLKQDIISSGNYVSVHVRRGDYLRYPDLYGGICTDEYYRDAIFFFKNIIDNPVFIFFSDDIDWVRENYREETAVYVSKDIFEKYEDWYDMSLMSVCKGNIIANSSFSWWGAWLNESRDHLVVKPKGEWIHKLSMEEVCPEEWIEI